MRALKGASELKLQRPAPKEGAATLTRHIVAAIIATLMIIGAAGPLLTQHALALGSGPSQANLSPSFLMLSNWVNDSFLVMTGIPIENASLDGLVDTEPMITNFYLGPVGLLPIELTFNAGFSRRAFLGLNNTVVIYSDSGYELQNLAPPGTTKLLSLVAAEKQLNAYVNISAGATVTQAQNGVVTYMSAYNLRVYLCTNGSVSYVSRPNYTVISISLPKGQSYVELSLNSTCNPNVGDLINYNAVRVDEWLMSSRRPLGLSSQALASEYYLSLLVLKDDQNPYLGTFAASPSPIYLYSWVRDSSFAAMALQKSGHLDSALKYWLWLLKAPQYGNGVWYTRYNFYTGAPDSSFGIPELDSVGIVEVGIYQYFMLTHNVTFLEEALPLLNKSVSAQVSWILGSKLHLVPEDLSVWEDRLGYHFWTQAFNYLGLVDAAYLLSYLGYNTSPAIKAASLLKESVIKHFWNGTAFYSDMTSEVLFTQNGSELVLTPQAPLLSSSSILPLALNLSAWPGYAVSSDVKSVLKSLWNPSVGGLARFYGDNYHYNEYLFDSSGPMPPWVITTLFLGLYYSESGNYSGATSALSWAYAHSQHGLLPEAVDPKSGLPLPTTSPLTWSSAMYVLVSLNISPRSGFSRGLYYAVSAALLTIVVIVAYILQRRSASRIRSLES